MSNNQPSLKKNIALSTFYEILAIVLPFITAPYVSRVLGPSGSGIYSYTNSIESYFAMFAALGTSSYGKREIARARNDLYRRSELFWEIELMTVMTSAACIAVWFVFIFFVQNYKIYFLALTMGLLSTMFDISWMFGGLEQFQYTVTKNTLFKLAGVILMFLFVRDSGDTLVYVIIITASQMLGNLSMWLYIPRFTTKVDFKKLRFKRHFRETFVYFIPSVATSVYNVLDRTLIGLITQSEAENGYYHYANQIINMLKAVTFSSLNSVLGSRIAYLFAEERFDEIKRRIRESINYIMFMGVGFCFGLIGVAARFVPVYFGPGYERVITMLVLMAPLVVIIGVSNCLGSQYYTPSGKRAQSARYIIAGAVTNFCLNMLFIPRYWGYGAIIATVAAEVLITVLYMKNCDGYLTVRTLWEEGWKKLAAGIVMLAVLELLDPRIHNDLIAIAVEVLCGVLVYCAVCTVLRDTFIPDILFGKILSRKKRRE